MDIQKFEERQEGSKSSHKKYDELLRSLNMDCISTNTMDSDIHDIAYLDALGLINYSWYVNDDRSFAIQLTQKGCIFRTEGGFAEQDRIEKEKNDEIELNKSLAYTSMRNSRKSLWVSGLATVITLAALCWSIYETKKPPQVKVVIIKQKMK